MVANRGNSGKRGKCWQTGGRVGNRGNHVKEKMIRYLIIIVIQALQLKKKKIYPNS